MNRRKYRSPMQRRILAFLRKQQGWITTRTITCKIKETDHPVESVLSTVSGSLARLLVRGIVIRKKEPYIANNKSRNGSNRHRGRREIWVWKIKR